MQHRKGVVLSYAHHDIYKRNEAVAVRVAACVKGLGCTRWEGGLCCGPVTLWEAPEGGPAAPEHQRPSTVLTCCPSVVVEIGVRTSARTHRPHAGSSVQDLVVGLPHIMNVLQQDDRGVPPRGGQPLRRTSSSSSQGGTCLPPHR